MVDTATSVDVRRVEGVQQRMALTDGTDRQHRPVALVTGAGRNAGIAAPVVLMLARTGWDVGFTYWTPYDERMPWGADPEARHPARES